MSTKRIVYTGVFPDGSQLMVSEWIDTNGEVVSMEAATRERADRTLVWGPPITLTLED